MKKILFSCVCSWLLGMGAIAQVTQINSNNSLHVIFPIDNSKTILVSNIDSSVWVTDATLAGTVQISPSIKYIGPSTLLGGKLIFIGSTVSTGSEVYATDGTPGGTVLVKDIYGGTVSSEPAEFVIMNGFIYFTATTAAEGRELWRTNGTNAGTTLVKDIITGPGGSNEINQYNLFPAGAYLLFAARTPASGIELWKSDGTNGGTSLLKDINTGNGGADSSNPASFYNINNVIIFTATDATHGEEVWKTDGTAVGTTLLKDINIGTGSSTKIELFPGFSFSILSSFHTFNGNAYFNAYDGTSTGQVWKTDGTSVNTTLLKDIIPGTSIPFILVLDAVNFPNKFIFPVSDGSSISALWVSDGTPGGTVLFKTLNPITPGDVPIVFVPYNFDFLNSTVTQPLFQGNKFFFTGGTATEGYELWISDGTLGGTSMVEDINTGTGDGINVTNGISYLYTSTALFFKGTNPATGDELWRSNGTAGGTDIVADIFTNAGSADPELTYITNGGRIIFSATNGDDPNHTDLYVVDGSFAPVPIKLFDFTVSLSGPDALLRWSTMVEINSKEFIVQRSADGLHFDNIGTVAAAGNSANGRGYLFMDQAIISRGKDIFYYRLLQSDMDGKTSYSNVIPLRLKGKEKLNVKILSNPVTDQVKVLLTGNTGDVQLSLVDAGGKILYASSVQNINGQLSLPVNLPAGIYILVAEGDKERVTSKFVKQ